jgi:hypothetical protein
MTQTPIEVTQAVMSDDDYNSALDYVNECMNRFRQAFFESNHAAMLAAMIMLNGGTTTILQTMGSPFATTAQAVE